MFECICGFPLTSLPVTVEVSVAQGASATPLTCPLCGERVEIEWQELGVFFRDRPGDPEYVCWKLPGVVEPRKTPSGWVVQKQRLGIRFKRLTLLEPREVCHQAVPVFLEEDGRLTPPLLPVRPEYFDCIDQAGLEELCANVQTPISGLRADRYFCHLPLKGLGVEQAVHIPSLPVQPAKRGTPVTTLEQSAFQGINLRIWPNVNFKEWRNYLVGLSANSEEAKQAFHGNQRLRVKYRTAGDGAKWEDVSVEMRGGDLVAATTIGRPRWVSLELEDMSGRDSGGQPLVMAGGIFGVPPAVEKAEGRPQIDLAIDFGTSNTCLAYKDETGRAQLIPQSDETASSLYLLRAGPESTNHEGPDLWPPERWFGPKKDLIPSEMLLREPRSEMAAQLSRIDQWCFGIDFGLPGAGVTLGYSEEEFLLAEFKWAEMITASAPAFRPYLEKIQQRYLTAVLTCALARVLASGKSSPGNVSLSWSYPMAFLQDDLESLRSAFAGSLHDLREATGLRWQDTGGGPNEARAAARNAGEPGADLSVYVDMGGGSSDIAVENPPYGGQRKPNPVFLTSVRYAGADLLSAFAGDGSAGSSCLAAGVGVDRLQRRVRESLRARDVMFNPDLFNTSFNEVVKNRTRHFYSYLTEYVARMIVSAVYENRAFRDGQGAPRLKVALYFLGNGWGFGGILDADTDRLFAIKVIRRAKEILKTSSEVQEIIDTFGEESTRAAGALEIEGQAHRLADVPHAKAAVAFGLLKETAPEQAGTDLGHRTGIVGHTTVVDRTRRVLWLRRTDRYDRPEGEDRLDLHDMFDWQDEDEPGFENGIATPFELDDGLNQTRAALLRFCKVAADGSEWLDRSPYEVMLETLFRDKIRTIGVGAYGRKRS